MIALYFDEHIPPSIAMALRNKGIDVLSAQEDGWDGSSDDDLLDRATFLDRALFTQDRDFLRIAAARIAAQERFAGILFARKDLNSIGKYVQDLEIMCLVGDLSDVENRVTHVPI